MISAYSFAMSVTLFNISLTVVYMLRRKKDFIAKYGIQTLMLITLLGWVRLVLPVDFEVAYVLRSHNIIPAIQNFLADRSSTAASKSAAFCSQYGQSAPPCS